LFERKTGKCFNHNLYVLMLLKIILVSTSHLLLALPMQSFPGEAYQNSIHIYCFRLLLRAHIRHYNVFLRSCLFLFRESITTKQKKSLNQSCSRPEQSFYYAILNIAESISSNSQNFFQFRILEFWELGQTGIGQNPGHWMLLISGRS